jgi:hypothetical protein
MSVHMIPDLKREECEWLEDQGFEFCGYFVKYNTDFGVKTGEMTYAFFCEGNGVTLYASRSFGVTWWSTGKKNAMISPQEALENAYQVKYWHIISTPWKSNPILTKHKINDHFIVDHTHFIPSTSFTVGESFMVDTEYVDPEIRKAISGILKACTPKGE